jgi:hypothetical protein
MMVTKREERLWKRFRNKWIKALRSGEYKQGAGKLCVQQRGGDEFCCFGVAADILVLDGYGKWLLKNKVALYKGANVFPAAAYLTSQAPGWVASRIIRVEDRLIRMNDSQGKTFAEIADWIEANL